MAERWYVAQAQPGRGRVAVEHLRRQAFDVFYPEIVDRKRVAPLFPGYLFVLLDLTGSAWKSVNGTRGVNHLLPAGFEQPICVAAGYVEDLQERAAAGEFDLRAAATVSLGYAPGEAALVIGGTMEGHTGEFLWQREDRVRLLFSLLGRRIPVTMPVEQVQPKASALGLR